MTAIDGSTADPLRLDRRAATRPHSPRSSQLYVGFNWYYVLTDRLDEGRAGFAPVMRLIATPFLS